MSPVKRSILFETLVEKTPKRTREKDFLYMFSLQSLYLMLEVSMSIRAPVLVMNSKEKRGWARQKGFLHGKRSWRRLDPPNGPLCWVWELGVPRLSISDPGEPGTDDVNRHM